MILIGDIGNTEIKIALYSNSKKLIKKAINEIESNDYPLLEIFETKFSNQDYYS